MTANKVTVERYMDGFRKPDHAFDAEIENPAFLGSPTITITRMVEEHDVIVAEGQVRATRRDGGVLTAAFWRRLRHDRWTDPTADNLPGRGEVGAPEREVA